MWVKIARAKYDCTGLRYASDLSGGNGACLHPGCRRRKLCKTLSNGQMRFERSRKSIARSAQMWGCSSWSK